MITIIILLLILSVIVYIYICSEHFPRRTRVFNETFVGWGGGEGSLCRPRGHSSARRRRCGNNRRAVILQCRGIIITFT